MRRQHHRDSGVVPKRCTPTKRHVNQLLRLANALDYTSETQRLQRRQNLKARQQERSTEKSPRLSVDAGNSVLYLSCCFMELPLYQHTLPGSKASFFFAWFRKINVYEPNTIHHRLKVEVIQEMIAGKIGFPVRERAREREKEREEREYIATWVVVDPSAS